ncbi:MAG: NAD-dependent epimerase/dehydratase family protein [Candidatus Peregrinibacteria bacterium]|nr:NAD-dependent epimerase/dehydratase family protein [Candidatus Peregrinibacteria bacterium]
MDSSFDTQRSGTPRTAGRGDVLVTGGAGFLGRNLCATLLALGYRVHAVDNFITGRRENIEPLLAHERFRFVECDIADPRFPQVFEDVPLAEVYHLACPTGVPNIALLSIEMLETCSIGTFAVLKLAREKGAAVLFTSSCEVYGQPEVCPQPTEYTGNVNPVGPRCPYEEGKRFSESLLITYVRKFGLNGKIVRIFNTYGPYMSPTDQRVMPQFLRSIRREEELVVYGDGSQTRTFLYVDDLIRALLLVMKEGKSGEVFNVGGTEQITITELGNLMIALTGYQKGIEYRPHFTEDHTSREPDVSKIRSLGWIPAISLEEGLKRMIAFQAETVSEGRTQPVAVGTMAP